MAAAVSGHEAASFARCLELLRSVGTHRNWPAPAGTRLAPIPENLHAWLSPLAKKAGPVWPRGQNWKKRERAVTAAQIATARSAGMLPWRHNSLRHSFCTYRVAATQDVPRMALEAGSSASTIFVHYRALATEVEGKAWFATVPVKPTRIGSDPRQAAAG